MTARSNRSSSPRRARPVGALVVALAIVAPAATRASDAPSAELVAEALFLRDDLPPGGRDLNFSVGFAEGDPDPETGRTSYQASPRLQLAMGLTERVGFTADVGFVNDGTSLTAPGASLKVLLRRPDAGKTGLAASVDYFGSSNGFPASETGLGVSAIRSVGRVALRAAVGVASGLSAWSPHAHGGASAALALGNRFHVLGELVGTGQGGDVTWGAGPSVKVKLGESAALMAGALLHVAPAVTPVFAVQLTSAL